MSNFNVILFRRPGGARKYSLLGYFLVYNKDNVFKAAKYFRVNFKRNKLTFWQESGLVLTKTILVIVITTNSLDFAWILLIQNAHCSFKCQEVLTLAMITHVVTN